MASFIVSLTYVAPIERIDELMDEHVAWLREQHAAGHLLGWGRKVPREGGILLARGENKVAIAALASQDPFVANGAATIEVIEWAHGFLDDSVSGLAG